MSNTHEPQYESTQLEHSEDKGSKLFTITICCIVTMGGFLFGYDTGVINGTIDGLALSFGTTTIGTGFNVASMLLGCAAGAFFAGPLADRFGRKKILFLSAFFFLFSVWGSGVAVQSAEFVVYRILGGLAVGAASILAPAYISEFAPARIRGRLSSIQQIAIISGILVAFISNYMLAYKAGASTALLWWGYEAWRWMFWAEIVPALIFLFGLIFIPESPRYLLLVKREKDAQKILAKSLGKERAQDKVKDIINSLEEYGHFPRANDLVNSNTNNLKMVVVVGIGLAVFQQLVGINVIFYYGAILWQSVGFTESDSLLISVSVAGISIVGCLLAFALIDWLGRKPLLVVGAVVMALSLAMMAVSFSSATITNEGIRMPGSYGLIALIAANTYVLFFNMSWGPVMWVMLGEMFPNQIRGSALAVCGFFQWGANFTLAMIFPILSTGIGLDFVYGLYALMAVLAALFAFKYVKETKGVELEEMDQQYE